MLHFHEVLWKHFFAVQFFVTFWCTIDLDQKLRNINGKPDGFIKLLTKKISYIGMSELVNIVIVLSCFWSEILLSFNLSRD